MTPVPELIVDPRALSPEHHLLRRLNHEAPTSLKEALRKVLRAYPGFSRLGTPEQPTAAARNAWFRLSQEAWTRTVRHGQAQGLLLTDEGLGRLELLWTQQVVTPYLKRLEHEFGSDVARRVAETLR